MQTARTRPALALLLVLLALALFSGAIPGVLQAVDHGGEPGAMIYFGVKAETPQASLRRAERIIAHLADNAYCITLAVSLANIRTLVEHPGSMTHSAIPAEEQVAKGLEPGGIRLAIGLERPEDIIQDLAHSLEFLAVDRRAGAGARRGRRLTFAHKEQRIHYKTITDNVRKEYAHKLVTAAEAVQVIQSGDRVYIHPGCAVRPRCWWAPWWRGRTCCGT